MKYSIYNLYSSIQSASLLRKKSIIYPYKTIYPKILKIIYKEGYINGFRLVLKKRQLKIEIFLKYFNNKSVISKLSIVSKPSRKIFLKVESLWKLKQSLYTIVLSTSKGILADKEARKQNLGGQILCILN